MDERIRQKGINIPSKPRGNAPVTQGLIRGILFLLNAPTLGMWTHRGEMS